MKTFKSISVILSFVVVLFNSCKKDQIKAPDSITVTSKQVKDGPIPAYSFNWETATTMPSATSTTANPVPMPWNSGTNPIDPNIVSDYKQADGWVLVHNTFSPSTILNDPNYVYFFSLYNVYRGLLRFYLWEPANSSATTYVNHGLSLYGAQTSPMLNFNTQEIVDPTQVLPSFNMVMNQQISATGGNWFVYQYEVAYDSNIATSTFPATGLTWASKWVNVSTITLNGTQTGSISSVGLGTPSSSFNLPGALVSAVTFLTGSVNYASIYHLTQDPYKTAVNNGVGGIIGDFLSGILGGSSSGNMLDLTMNTNISLTGSITSTGSMENMKLILPGQSNSQTGDGNTPLYNQTLGVFNILDKPVIQVTENDFSVDGEDPYSGSPITDYGFTATCWVNPSDVHIVTNPAIINSSSTGATITNINYDVVTILPQPGSGSTPGIYNYDYAKTTFEQIGSSMLIASYRNPTSSVPFVFNYYTQVNPNEGFYQYTPTLALRVSLEVTPNNGGPKSTLVKTFKVATTLR